MIILCKAHSSAHKIRTELVVRRILGMNIPVESCQRSLDEEINYLSFGKNNLCPMTRDAEDVKVWTACQSGTFSTKTFIC